MKVAARPQTAGQGHAAPTGGVSVAQTGVTSYPPEFFAFAHPNTALDMVDQLPGFALDTGSSVRGYEGAAGNVLIDGERPTAKSEGVDSILQRMLATHVARIDVIRGAAPGIDMQGKTVIANVITKISTPDGKVLYQNTDSGPGQVVAPDKIGMMNNMLATVVDVGTGKGADLPGWQIAGKTGTSQKGRDALFIGYSAHMVTGVWLGNDNDAPTTLTGGSLPAAIWTQFMQTAHKGVSPQPLPGSYEPSQEDLMAEQELATQQGQVPGDYVPPDQQGPGVQQQQQQAPPRSKNLGDLINSLFGQ